MVEHPDPVLYNLILYNLVESDILKYNTRRFVTVKCTRLSQYNMLQFIMVKYNTVCKAFFIFILTMHSLKIHKCREISPTWMWGSDSYLWDDVASKTELGV